MAHSAILGKYPTHYHYTKSPEWYEKHNFARQEYRRKGKFYCVVCRNRNPTILNHMTYERIGHEDIWTDLNWMCRSCHHDFHYKGILFKRKLSLKPHDMKRRLYWITFLRSLRQCIFFQKDRYFDVLKFGILLLVG